MIACDHTDPILNFNTNSTSWSRLYTCTTVTDRMLSAHYVRSPMAKAILQKMADRQSGVNVSPWYHLELKDLTSELQEKYIPSHFDRETELFLEGCYEKSDFVLTQFFHAFLKAFLQFFFSFTTINGLLSRGSMFVFSNEQFMKLVDYSSATKMSSLLDIGAGDGKVTKIMAPYFNQIFVTETSTTMRWRLSEYGYQVVGIDEWQASSYSLVSALNVIDRVDHPQSLLKDLQASMEKGNGLLLLAIVLPYQPCVEKAGHFDAAAEALPISGETAEEQINSLVHDVFQPLGLEVLRFTKVPYLCEGDLHKDFFVLDDYVFVLRSASL